MKDNLEFVSESCQEGDRVRVTIEGVVVGVNRRMDYGNGPTSIVDEKKKAEKPVEKRFIKVEYSEGDLTAKAVGTEAQKGAKKIIENMGGEYKEDDDQD